ncbi:MAG TPA: hypothetical protein VL463_27545 [Kofleriaceae bacterium]|jgi:hypothetical protein|nr:hypothetical protein [Kofleriaceae bacterium]
MLKALSTVLAVTALVGCIDAKKSFDDYESRVVDGNTSLPDHPMVDKVPDATGHFLFGVHVKAAGPTSKPIQLVGDYVVVDNGDGTAKLSYNASALRTADRQISTENTAPQFMAADMPVAKDGTFETALKGQLPGDANPVSPGTPIDADATLHGVVMSKDLICGTLTGTALVDLTGSTWAAIRIKDTDIGDTLPDPVVACP